MPTHVALLRAVNLAGINKVRMPDLCAMLDKLGFKESRSLLQSGNLVFEGQGRSPEEMEALFEATARKRLGLDTDFFVRTAKQWQAISGGYRRPTSSTSPPISKEATDHAPPAAVRRPTQLTGEAKALPDACGSRPCAV